MSNLNFYGGNFQSGTFLNQEMLSIDVPFGGPQLPSYIPLTSSFFYLVNEIFVGASHLQPIYPLSLSNLSLSLYSLSHICQTHSFVVFLF